MKYYLLLPLLVLLSLYASAQIKNPYLTLTYDSVMLYSYPDGWNNVVDERGRLEQSINQRIRLSDSAIRSLNKKLGAKSSYGNDLIGCFSPHMGFVWYKDQQIVGHISVCLQCRQFYSNLPIGNDSSSNHPLSVSFYTFFGNIREQYGFPEYTEPIYNSLPPAILKVPKE